MVNTLGWVGNAFFMCSTWCIARKNIIGFHLNICGNIIYIYIGLNSGLHALTGISIWLVAMNIYGIINWRKSG